MAQKKILLVDDEEEIVDFLKELLEEKGYLVLTAKDGETAFDLIQNQKPDLTLLDLNIPKMSGFQILEALKPKETGIKILICSGLYTKEDEDKALALGALGYVSKPIDLESLTQEIERLA